MDPLARDHWRKSTRSSMNGCVEVALIGGQVAVRDSKDARGPVLMFTAAEWTAFLQGARDGEFDIDTLAAAPANHPSP